MFAGYNNDYRESKDNYNRKSMLSLLKCQITPLGVNTHRLRTTAVESSKERTSSILRINHAVKLKTAATSLSGRYH